MEKLTIILVIFFVSILLADFAKAQINSSFLLTWDHPETTGKFYLLKWEGTDTTKCLFKEDADFKGDAEIGDPDLRSFVIDSLDATVRNYAFKSKNDGQTIAFGLVYESPQGYYSPLAVSDFLQKSSSPFKPANIVLKKVEQNK